MRRPKINSLRKFEVLEDRRMMAGISYNSNTDTITIDGDSYDDVAQVRFEDDRVYVDLTTGVINGGSEVRVPVNKRISDVSKIVFNGQAGNDKLALIVNNLNSGVTVDNVVLEFHGHNGEDTLTNNAADRGVKTLAWGDSGNDLLSGGRYDDILEGGAGDDSLYGYSGDDTYVFSGIVPLGTDSIVDEGANVGIDTLDFTNFGQTVYVNLEKVYNGGGSQFSYAATSDVTYAPNSKLNVKLYDSTAIENVIGTAYRDFIGGNSRSNYLSGGGGDDQLCGQTGNDTLDGGTGSDQYWFIGGNLGTDTIIENGNDEQDALDFTGMLNGVTVDLTKFGTSYAVDSADLRLILGSNTAIETVRGTKFDDTIVGNSRNNILSGGEGKDVITGGAGADHLYGDGGEDKLWGDALDQAYGGLGNDWFDGYYEGTPRALNPRLGRYMDWKLI